MRISRILRLLRPLNQHQAKCTHVLALLELLQLLFRLVHILVVSLGLLLAFILDLGLGLRHLCQLLLDGRHGIAGEIIHCDVYRQWRRCCNRYDRGERVRSLREMVVGGGGWLAAAWRMQVGGLYNS